MADGDMRIRIPGLSHESHGKARRWRVRVEGERTRKITIPVGPDHDDFQAHYKAARRGEKLSVDPDAKHDPGTMGWLMASYIEHLTTQVETGHASPLTLKQRKSHKDFILSQTSEQTRTYGRPYAGLPMTIPPAEMMALQDRMRRTPGKALNVWKTLTAAFEFARERGHITSNPAKAVRRPQYANQGGATPWTLDDLKKFREAHPKGTTAHLCLSLMMFTACRISDAVILGRRHEDRINGALWLSFDPVKKGAASVLVPVLPPLEAALRSRGVIGDTYLLTDHGKPFASPEALRNRFKKWCRAAGLEDRSSHGIRKAAGELMALAGATQYEIMAVHGHTNSTTSQVYTKSVERMRLAEMGASKLAGMEW
jgi:integrase